MTATLAINMSAKWAWKDVLGDGNCYWHACSVAASVPWTQIKEVALQSVEDETLQHLYHHVNLADHRNKHQTDGVYADEIMLLATALAGGVHVIVLDVDSGLLYNIQPDVIKKVAIFKLQKEHYEPLEPDRTSEFMKWFEKQKWDWVAMFKDKHPIRLLGGSGTHALSAKLLRPYRSGAVAMDWNEEWDPHHAEHEPDVECRDWTLTTVNVQGIRTALPTLLADETEVMVCTETNMPKSDLRDVTAACWEHGYESQHWVAPHSGIAVLCKKPFHLHVIDLPDCLQMWTSQGRLAAMRLLDCMGSLLAVLVVAYIPAGFYKNVHSKQQVDLMWENVKNWVTGLGDVPLIITGDLNDHWINHGHLQDLVNGGMLVDAIEKYEGSDRKPTFGQSAVLDHILTSPHLMQLSKTAYTTQVPYPADHRAVVAKFSSPCPTLQSWPRLRYAKAMPKEATLPYPDEMRDVQTADNYFRVALEQRDLDGALEWWSVKWETLLLNRCHAQGVPSQACLKGRDRLPTTQYLRPQASQQGGRMTQKGRALRNLRLDTISFERYREQMTENEERSIMQSLQRRAEDSGIVLTQPLCDWMGTQALLMHLDLTIEEYDKEQASTRWHAWKAGFERKNDPHMAKAFKYVKAMTFAPLWAVRTAAGSTTDVKEMDQEIRKTWLGLCMPATSTLEKCRAEFAAMDTMPQQPPLPLPPLLAGDLVKVAKGIGAKKAPGLTSWRPNDLRALPPAAFGDLAELFTLCEHVGRFPVALTQALVSFIPKEQAKIMDPSKVRPIAVLPLVLRLYLSLRAAHITTMLDRYLLDQQWGGRRSRGVNQPLILTDLLVDLAVKGFTDDVWIGQLDVQKYFNNIDARAVLPSMVKAGVPVELVNLLTSLYTELNYYNKYHSGILGPAWRPCRGIPQHDPCGVVMANWYMMVLVRHANVSTFTDSDQEMWAGACGCHVFLDDVTLVADSHQRLQNKITALADAMQRVGLVINTTKSGWLSTKALDEHQKIQLHGYDIPRVEGVTLLGVDLIGQHEDEQTKASKRLATCKARLERIPRLPIGEDARAHLVAASALSPLAYMPIGSWAKLDGRWTRRVSCVLKKCNPNQWIAETAMEVLYFTMHAGHLLAYPWTRWYQVAKLVALAARLALPMITKLLEHATPSLNPKSIADTFVKLSADLRLTLHQSFVVTDGPRWIDLRQGRRSWAEHLHGIREFMRQVNAARLEARRPGEFAGIGQGIDRELTMMGIRALDKKGEHLLAAAARRWQCGGMRSRERHVRHTKRHAPIICEQCGQIDDLQHILWTCSRWTKLRVWEHYPAGTPRCLYISGVVPCGWRGDKAWLRSYLINAPRLICAYMQWVVHAPESCWIWPTDEPEALGAPQHDPVGEQPLPAPPRSLQGVDWSQLIRRRVRGKQKPPRAYRPDALQEVNGHRLKVKGRPSRNNRDRGVSVVLQCVQCLRQRTHTRRIWFTLNGCPKSLDNELREGPCGRWRFALAPYLPNWSVAWRKGLPRLTCRECGWTFCPIRIRHLQPRVAAHVC